MEIISYEFNEEGMSRVYQNEKWLVGIKNWKPENDVAQINCLERHNETDELFVLVAGRCILVSAVETDGRLKFSYIDMEPLKVYNIPRSLWHNTITEKDTKLVLVEDSSTSMKNSDIFELNNDQIKLIKNEVQQFI